jgi:hypothetical protein
MSARIATALLLFACVAHAHPEVDRAIECLNDADFDGALAALERAESSSDLSAADLASLLARRAMVHLAIGDETAMQTDLEQLGALEPDYAFGVWAPPALREAFEHSRPAHALALVVEPRADGDRTRFEARVENDPGGLVRSIRIRARIAGAWTDLDSADPIADASALEYYAEAVGPGTLIVARVASVTEPRRFGEIASPHGDDSALWWGLGIGAGAAAAIVLIVVIAVVASSGSGQTSFAPPVVTFP